MRGETEAEEEKKDVFLLYSSRPPATQLGRGGLVELRSCNWVVAITGKKIHPGPSKDPSRPTTLISADLMVLGKSLNKNKVFTSFSHLIQAKNS